MKKHLLLFLLSFIFVTSASGDDVKSFSLTFEKSNPGSAKVEYSISESAKSAKAIVSTSEGTICDTYTLHTGNGSFDCNLSKFPKGIISLSLIVDGKLIDSAKIDNK